jgi:hypothetical protein
MTLKGIFEFEGEGAKPIAWICQANSPGEVNPTAQLLPAANQSERATAAATRAHIREHFSTYL